MLDPEQSKKEIYDFMGMKVDNKKGNEEELKRPISPRRPIRANQALEKDLKPDLVRDIESECQALADAVGVKWRRPNEKINDKKHKHFYNISTLLDQRRRRWADIVQMSYKCFVFAG